MVLAAQAGSIEPGAEAETVVLVRNTGEAPDVFHVVVQGDASGWAVVDPPSLRLAPGEEAPAWVHFRPPRSFDTPPGAVPYAVAVASSGDPDFIAVESGDLHIGTFSSVTAAFTAEPTVGARWVEVPVSVRNTGNRTVTVSVEVEAAGGVVTDVDPPETVLEPGQPSVALVRVRPPRRTLPNRRDDRRLTVSVVSDGGALATLRTEYPGDPSLVNELIRSARVLGVLLLLLFFGGIALLRSESTSGTVDVTEGSSQAPPAQLPSAPPEEGTEEPAAQPAVEEQPPAQEEPPPPPPAVPPAATGPPNLPRLVFVRVYSPSQRDIVVREPGARGAELRLRAEGTLERRPRLSPDGASVAFIGERDGAWRVCVVQASGGEAVCVADTTADAAVAWSPDGTSLHFSRGGSLFTVDYDATSQFVGPEIDTGVAVPGGAFALSPDGRRVAVSEGRRILLRAIDGSGGTSIDVPRPASDVSFSPDGQRVLYTSEYQLHVVGVGGGAVRQLTRPGTVNGEGTWTGVDDWVVFRSNRSGTGDLYAVKGRASGGDETGLAQVTTTAEREVTPSF